MKTFQSTWIMAVFVILVAGYTYWDYHEKSSGDAVDTSKERKLFNFKNEDVQSVRVTRGTDVLLIERGRDGWSMKQPVEDLVENSSIDGLLYSMQVQKGKIFRGEDDAKSIKWADFGLEPAGSTLEIKTKDKTETVLVSSRNAFDGSFYLRQGNELVLGDRAFAQAVLRDPKTFRSHRLWRDPDSKFDKVDVQLSVDANKKEHFAASLEKDGGAWTITPKPSFSVSPTKIAQWVDRLEAFNPVDIVGDSLSDEDKHNFLLLKPSAVLTLHYKTTGGKDGDWVITLGQDKAEDIYLYSSLRPTVYKANKSQISTLRVSADFFRDGQAPFHLPLDKAREIEIINGEVHHLIKKTDLLWKVADATDSKSELDQDRLVKVIQDLGTLDAQEFLPASDAKGFKPDRHIVLRDEHGQSLLDFSWGDTYKAKRPFNAGQNLQMVRLNGGKEVMGVSSVKVATLTDTKTLFPAKKPAPAAPTTKTGAKK